MKSFELIKTEEIHKLEISGESLELKEKEIKDVVLHIYNEWLKDHLPSEYFPCKELLSQTWCWKDGTKRTLPQRIDRIFKERQFYLNKGYLGEIGNAIREAIPIQAEYYIDITQDLNWTEGDFNDADSCMWDGRKGVKDEMSRDGRFYAFRFYDRSPTGTCWGKRFKDSAGNNYTGVARTWLFKDNVYIHHKKKVSSQPIFILFNSYGKPLRQQASIFAVLMDGVSKSITLANQKRTVGGLYINNGGYIIGSPSTIENISHFDLGLKNAFDGPLDEEEDAPERLLTGLRHFISLHDDEIQKQRWFKKRRRKKKRYKQAINNILARVIHYQNKDTLHYLLHRSRSHVLPYWRRYQRLLRGNFFGILLKILSYKITNGDYNDNPKKKS